MANQIISRADARVQGHRRYFTGIPCKRGHVAERHVSNLTCMECQREKAAAAYPMRDKVAERQRLAGWREANREKVNARSRAANATSERKAYTAAWYKANKERARPAKLARYAEQRAERVAYSKAWAEANPGKVRAWKEKNKEKIKLRNARRRKENRDQIYASNHKRRALKKNSGGTHTGADVAAILKA